MEPQLVDRIVTPKGHTILRKKPHVIRQAVRKSTARELAEMMRGVVSEGTGTAAQIAGYSVAGKTGTAETGAPTNTTWFIAFAGRDEESPAEVAVAVVLQNQSGVGGTTAAPIARAVMEAILSSRKNP
jgi:peptidoglycan glycosyltransferase